MVVNPFKYLTIKESTFTRYVSQGLVLFCFLRFSQNTFLSRKVFLGNWISWQNLPKMKY